MRALITDGTRPRLVTGQAEPRPAAGEAVIRPTQVAVSRFDVELARGRTGFEGVLGRDFVGVVESVEGAAAGDLVGRRVVATPHAVCGACDMCRRGLASHCRNQTILGFRGRPGCLAERFALPASCLVPVPDSLDDDHAVFAGPLASAMQSARQLTVEGKPYITVLGDSPHGLLVAQVMSALNASVRVVGGRPARLALCEKWSVKHRHANDIGRRADQDIVVECTGSAAGLRLALELVRPRGTVILKEPPDPCDLDLTPVLTAEIELVGSFTGPVAEAVAVLDRREVDVVSLRGRRMRLDDGPAILQAAADPDALMVIVEFPNVEASSRRNAKARAVGRA